MTVSVVIPTLGRPSLDRAVASVLAQTSPVSQIVVVADTDRPISLPADDRIALLRNMSGGGPAGSRQVGIDAAHGSVIALLDDDDEWHLTKIECQLAAAASAGPHWIASCRMAAIGPGDRRRVWPRRLIAGESVADYLFRFTDVRLGGRSLQTSTLCFPAELARAVRWDAHTDSVHDEPSWVLDVARRFPDLAVIQLPQVLSTYNVANASVSRHTTDTTDRYIDGGLRYLVAESSRVRGDYLCTSPVSAAVAAGSPSGVMRSMSAAFRNGRPGLPAVGFASMSAARVVLRRLQAAARR